MQPILRRVLLTGASAFVLVMLSSVAHADPFMLGQAGGYTVIGSQSVILNQGNVNGNVGVGGGSGSLMKSTVNGNVVLASGASPDIHNQDFVLNGTISRRSITNAINDAQIASATLAAMNATQSFGNITSTVMITGGGGTNVIAMSSVDLNHGTLTLSGGANERFIINVAGGFQLSHAQIVLSGGLTANNVIFNFANAGDEIKFNKADTAVFGTFLAPFRDIEVKDSGLVLNGVVIGRNVVIHSGAQVNGPEPVPEPATLLLLGSGIAGVAAKLRKRRKATDSTSENSLN